VKLEKKFTQIMSLTLASTS